MAGREDDDPKRVFLDGKFLPFFSGYFSEPSTEDSDDCEGF